MHIPSRSAYLVFLLWLVGLCAAGQFTKIAVPFSYVQEIYPHIGSELGWLLSLVSLMGAVLGVVAGSLVNWMGPKKILLFALVLGAGISLWQATFPAFPFMLISRVIEGVSHLAIVVAAPTLIGQLCSDRYRGMAMAFWSTFFGVSFALMAWFGMPIVIGSGLGSLFVTHAALMLTFAILLAVGLKGYAPNHPKGAALSMDEIVTAHREAYRSPFISAPGMGWLFYTLTYVSLLAIIPLQFAPEIGSRIAGIMSAISICSAMILIPVLLKWCSSVQIVIIGFVGGIGVSLLRLFDVPLEFICITLFLVLGLVQGASFSAVPELNKTSKAQALSYGLLAQMGNIGNLLGTPLLLAIFAWGGEARMFVIVAALYLGAIIGHIVLGIRRNAVC